MTVYTENPKESKDKLIREDSEVVGYKNMAFTVNIQLKKTWIMYGVNTLISLAFSHTWSHLNLLTNSFRKVCKRQGIKDCSVS